jgi:hypothetical protein
LTHIKKWGKRGAIKNNKMSTLLNSKKKAIHYSRSSVNREIFFTGEGGGGWWNT